MKRLKELERTFGVNLDGDNRNKDPAMYSQLPEVDQN